MPCWQARSTTVELKAANFESLVAAFKQIYGERIRADEKARTIYFEGYIDGEWGGAYYRDGKVEVSASSQITTDKAVNRIKASYSEQVLQANAKRFGWNLRKQANGKFQIIKRTVGR